jgi:hypothetical protein
LAPESDVLDAREEVGVLEELYTSLALDHKDMFLNHLRLSEEHYLAGKWGDCIANSRSVLECTLREVAAWHSQNIRKMPLPPKTYKSALEVRDYLEAAKLISLTEKEALWKVYGLLSGTGNHPNMAESDQARLMRHLALTFSQFVLLRLQGALK